MLKFTLNVRMLRGTAVCLFEVADVRERIRIERRRKELKQQMSGDTRAEELTDEEVAQQCGLTPPTVFDKEELRRSKDAMTELVRQQREKRLAKQEAFLSWQAGQREKGSANRLAREAKKAERWKRQHCSQMGHKLLSTSLSNAVDGSNTNDGIADDAVRAISRATGRTTRGERLSEMHTTCDILNEEVSVRQTTQRKVFGTRQLSPPRVHLTLSRGLL